jgi:hypothetical protein
MEPIISTAAAPVTANRRTVDQVRVFQAPDSLVHNLQKLLVDLIELHLQGKQVRKRQGVKPSTQTCCITGNSITWR